MIAHRVVEWQQCNAGTGDLIRLPHPCLLRAMTASKNELRPDRTRILFKLLTGYWRRV